MSSDNGGIIGVVNDPTSTTASGVWQQEEQYEAKVNDTWPQRPLFTTKSLRFNDGSSDSLNRTPSGDGNKRTFTFSTWLKISTIKEHMFFTCGVYSSTSLMQFYLNANGTLTMSQETSGGSIQSTLTTTQVFRDTSAWYHLVIAIDTTQGTASNRLKLYVNGTQVTSFSTETYPSQNTDFACNTSGVINTIGNRSGGNFYFDGYMSHVALVDGQALAPTVFGQTDSTSGIWKFKQPSGVTWGTNGFWLKFENSGALGTDSSGQSNTFAVNGNGRQALDTPSNVYATMNSLDQNGGMTFSEGNLSVASTSASWRSTRGTLGVTQGKWYYEVKVTNVSGANLDMMVGWGDFEIAIPSEFSSSNPALTYTAGSGNKQLNGVNSSYGDSYNINDIIGVAFDADNLTVEFFKNGTSQGSISTGCSSGITWTPVIALYGRYNNTKASFNFGNGYFGTTAVSSAGTNASGNGIFEYDVPSGYYALNTKNINTYG